MKPLIANLVNNYKKELETLNYTDIFKNLLLRYEQNIESTTKDADVTPRFVFWDIHLKISDAPMSTISQQKDGWSRTDEDAYFNSLDDDEETAANIVLKASESHAEDASGKAASGPLDRAPKLVDYPDDDDEELVRPKPASKPIKLSITLSSNSQKEIAKGLVGESSPVSEAKSAPPVKPLEFVRSTLDDPPQVEHSVKRQRKL